MSKYDSVYQVLQKPVAQHQRNIFPLDHAHTYSMKAGQINIVKALHYKPQDYFDIKIADFSITKPMNTCPFIRGRKEFALYSVYYNAVWSLFNQFMSTRKDNKTSVFGENPLIQYEPAIKLLELYGQVVNQWIGYEFYDKLLKLITGDPDGSQLRTAQSFWLSSIFGGMFNTSTSWNSVYSNLSDITKYSTSFSGPLLNDCKPKDVAINATNRDFYFDIIGEWRWGSYCRKLEMLGYGNIYPLLKAAEAIIIEQVSNADYSDSSSLAAAILECERVIMSVVDQVIQMCCSYTGSNFVNPGTVTFAYKNLYPICAYNSVFYHMFRNSYYDNDYKSYDYSLDFVSIVPGNNNNIVHGSDFSMRFLDIEYHQWKKDKFTAVLPDQQYGSVSQLTMNVNLNPNVKANSLQSGNIDSLSVDSLKNVKGIQGGSSSILTVGNTFISPSFDMIALKRAEMLQDYRQTLMRAGNKTSDVFRALYGKAPNSEHSEDIIPRFLDTFGMDMFVDPVTATADTGVGSNGKLGDLSARGKFSGESGKITFNADGDFGLILILNYIVPTAEYNSYMLDPHLGELTPEQHYIAQFENLGLEDIYLPELNSNRALNGIVSLGKVPRYHQKKSELSVVHGAFCSSRYSFKQGTWVRDGLWYGEFNHWVCPRTDLQSRLATTLRDFYINPSILDNVFVEKSGPDLSRDQFICRTYLDIQSTKELSKVGLINFV